MGDNSYGPVFGYSRTDEVDICFMKNVNLGITNDSRSFKTNKELNNGKPTFETKELEVYQVIIN